MHKNDKDELITIPKKAKGLLYRAKEKEFFHMNARYCFKSKKSKEQQAIKIASAKREKLIYVLQENIEELSRDLHNYGTIKTNAGLAIIKSNAIYFFDKSGLISYKKVIIE